MNGHDTFVDREDTFIQTSRAVWSDLTDFNGQWVSSPVLQKVYEAQGMRSDRMTGTRGLELGKQACEILRRSEDE